MWLTDRFTRRSKRTGNDHAGRAIFTRYLALTARLVGVVIAIPVVCIGQAYGIYNYPDTSPRTRPAASASPTGVGHILSDTNRIEFDGSEEYGYATEGTGSLIDSPRIASGHLVLTAAHVLPNSFNWFRSYDIYGNITQEYAGLRVKHPNYGAGNIPNNDLGLLLTAEAVNGHAFQLAASRPSPPLPFFSGEALTYAGFGCEGCGEFRVKRIGQGSMGPNVSSDQFDVFYGAQGTERGDSGGPVYVSPTDGIIGVLSSAGPDRVVVAPVETGSYLHDWALGSTIANMEWYDDYPQWGDFYPSDLVPEKVLNANIAGWDAAWELGRDSLGKRLPYRVLGLLNDEPLELHRTDQGIIYESGNAAGASLDKFSPEILIVGESGTLNGRNGKIHVSSGEFVTSSLHNLGTVLIKFEPYYDDQYIQPLIRVTGPDGVLNEGTISGTRRIELVAQDAQFINAGTVSPGASPGKLTIAGRYLQTETGVLHVEIHGIDAETKYDVLAIEGQATLLGALNISFINGYGTHTPVVANSFRVMTATGGISGGFQQVNLPLLASNLVWQLNYSSGAVDVRTAAPSLLVGDFDLDNDVDQFDYAVWRREFGFRGSFASDGNRNGIVDAADYVIWRDHVGSGVGALASIPEPVAFVTMMFGLGCACIFIQRRGRR